MGKRAAAIAAFILLIGTAPLMALAEDLGRELSLHEMKDIYGAYLDVNAGGNVGDVSGTISGNDNNVGVNSAQGNNNSGNIGVGSVQCGAGEGDTCASGNANVGINSNMLNGSALAGANAVVIMNGVNSTAHVQMNVLVIQNSTVSGGTFSGSNTATNSFNSGP